MTLRAPSTPLRSAQKPVLDYRRDDRYSSGASPADDESCPVTRFNELVFAMILAGVFRSYTCRFGTFCAKSAEKIIAATKKDRLQL